MKKLLSILFAGLFFSFRAMDLSVEYVACANQAQQDGNGRRQVTLNKDQKNCLIYLQELIVTEQLYRLACQKRSALEIIRQNKYLIGIFVNLITGNQDRLSNTCSARIIKEFLQAPECKSFLLQMRNQFANTLHNVTSENILKFKDSLIRVLEVLRTFDHHLIKRITLYFDSLKKLFEIINEELVFPEAHLTTSISSSPFLQINDAFYGSPISNFDTYSALLAEVIEQYESKREEYHFAYLGALKSLPRPLFDMYKSKFIAFGGLNYITKSLDINPLQLIGQGYSKERVNSLLIQAEKNRKEAFLPAPLRVQKKNKKEQHQKKKPPKRKKRRKKRLYKVSGGHELTQHQKEEKVVILKKQKPKSQSEILKEQIRSYYPGIEFLALQKHVVRFTDTINKRTFELYNATGNTEHCNPEWFHALAELPQLHSRVARWFKDIDTAIQQVENEVGMPLVGEQRKVWIKNHQLPVKVLYYFRKMGYIRKFIDKSGSSINSLYLIGCMKETKKQDLNGYFGFGFLPDAKKPTIYHACFESRPFRSILVQDKELTQEQKNNLSQAFRLKDTLSD